MRNLTFNNGKLDANNNNGATDGNSKRCKNQKKQDKTRRTKRKLASKKYDSIDDLIILHTQEGLKC